MDIDIILDLSNLIRYENQNVRKSCITKKVISFLSKISQLPKEITDLKQKYNSIYSDVQTLKEKVYRIDGQMDICWRIVDKLVSD